MPAAGRTARQWRTGFRLLVASPPRTLVNFRFHPEFRADRGVHGETEPHGRGRQGSRARSSRERSCANKRPRASSRISRRSASAFSLRRRPWRTRQRRLYVVHESCAASHEPSQEGEDKQLRLRRSSWRTWVSWASPTRASPLLISPVSAAEDRRLSVHPLTPNLGVVGLSDDRSFVVADVPGLIEGARWARTGLPIPEPSRTTEGAGACHRRVLRVGPGSVDDFDVIERELTLFKGRPDEPSDARVLFSEKPRLAAANKIDALDDPSRLSRLAAHLKGEVLRSDLRGHR